jgi:hypothetical protein
MVVGDINTPQSLMDRSPTQKINKEILELKNTIDLMDLTYIYRVFHQITAQYTFFTAAHGIFSTMYHILDSKKVSTNTRKSKLFPAYCLTTIQ